MSRRQRLLSRGRKVTTPALISPLVDGVEGGLPKIERADAFRGVAVH
jgi:hypothetical protein